MKRRSKYLFLVGLTLAAGAAGCQSSGGAGRVANEPSLAESREYLFVGSGGGQEAGYVSTYDLDRSTGVLRLIDRKQVGGPLVSFLAVNPRHSVVYATDPRTRKVHWLRVDPSTGMLTADAQQSQAASGGPEHLTVDRTGSVLIGVNFGTGTADVFPLDPVTGAIQPKSDSISTGRNPHFAEFSPDNRYAYIGTQVDNYVSQFSFDGGRLSPLSPPTVARLAPRQFGFHPNGRFAYTVSGPTDNVSTYTVASNGTLTPTDSVRRMPDGYSGSLNSTGGTINITPSGRFAYVNNRGSNTVAIYSVGADGRLTNIGHEPTRGFTPRHADMDPDGELLVVGNQESQSIAIFRIDQETGALSLLNSVHVGVSPYYIGIRRLRPN